jgi:hypothetical protein
MVLRSYPLYLGADRGIWAAIAAHGRMIVPPQGYPWLIIVLLENVSQAMMRNS